MGEDEASGAAVVPEGEGAAYGFEYVFYGANCEVVFKGVHCGCSGAWLEGVPGNADAIKTETQPANPGTAHLA